MRCSNGFGQPFRYNASRISSRNRAGSRGLLSRRKQTTPGNYLVSTLLSQQTTSHAIYVVLMKPTVSGYSNLFRLRLLQDSRKTSFPIGNKQWPSKGNEKRRPIL